MENRFKRALAAGQVQYGLWLGLSDPYGSEIAAGSGFDWLLIDGEHAPNDLRAVLGQLQVIAAYPDTHPVARPVEGDAALLKQLLDIGCQTLLVPMIETAEQAAAMVAAVRYPPQGIRGVGAALARASRWGTTPEYLKRANEEVCLLLQVETAKGLENLEAIATTEGVDGVFIGPADLAASMGHLGNAAHPDVRNAVVEALRTIARLGKAPGILTTEPALVETYREAGALFIAVGVDTVLLAQASRALAATFKGNRSTAPGEPSLR